MMFMYLGSLILRGATLASMVTVRLSLSTTTPDFSAARPETDRARISSSDARFIGNSFQFFSPLPSGERGERRGVLFVTETDDDRGTAGKLPCQVAGRDIQPPTMQRRPGVHGARRLHRRVLAQVERPLRLAVGQPDCVDDPLQVRGVGHPAGYRGRREIRSLRVVDETALAGGEVKAPDLAVGCRRDGEVLRQRDGAQHAAEGGLATLALAGGEIEGRHLTLGTLEPAGVIGHITAADHDNIALHRRPAPRVELQRCTPLDLARCRIEGEEGTIADFLLVEERGADQDTTAGDRDRRIDMPLLVALLPQLHR